MTVALHSLPVLTQDDTRMDWERARYWSKVQVQPGKAFIANELYDAPELAQLVEHGSAQWVVDVRCPKALYARTEQSSVREFEVRWPTAETDGPVYLRPGLVAIQDLRLSASGLIDLWGAGEIDVPKGWWLAQGKVVSSKSLSESLLMFRQDDSLSEGRMSVQKDLSTGNLRFIVGLAPHLYETRHADRDIHMAGLIAAFGLLGCSPPSEDAEDAILQGIKAKLDEAGVPDWEDENYDPAQAATVIEQFGIAVQGEDNDD